MSEQSERSPIQLQDMTLEKEAGQKQEVQKLQELPQQQQGEDDHEEEEEEHTSTSLKASHAVTEQTREEQPREQEEKKEDDEDKEVDNITVSPPSETPFKQSERFPIQDMTEEKEEEGQKQEAQTLQELPQQQQTEEDTATSLNVSHAGEQTIEEQPKEPEQGQEEGKEQEAQNLQELPQQQQREEEEEKDTATSHYNASNAREQEQGQEDVDISSATLPLMMRMKTNKWRLSPVTPAKRPAQKSDTKDVDCQGIKKKTRTKVTCDKPPTTFLESVLTDVDYEIGFLNCIIDYYHNNARYPYYDYIAVDDFIKNWLEVDATQRQLIDVILKLRKKYKETLAKMGVAKKFSDPLHQRASNLAQRIWTNSGFKEDWKNLKKSGFIASPFP